MDTVGNESAAPLTIWVTFEGTKGSSTALQVDGPWEVPSQAGWICDPAALAPGTACSNGSPRDVRWRYLACGLGGPHDDVGTRPLHFYDVSRLRSVRLRLSPDNRLVEVFVVDGDADVGDRVPEVPPPVGLILPETPRVTAQPYDRVTMPPLARGPVVYRFDN